ncbi:SRPBCC family protein [Microbaculum marinum]|uniref:SRPBCC family protein n=1 Tax=Microbaculum marinum TaxID=1764581 RepID=A0AAW9RVB3_9HYPH
MAIVCNNSFRLTLPPPDTWALLQQLDLMATCFPGGTLSEWDGGDSFVGEVATRLGPMSMVFRGKGRILERDADTYRMRVRGEGAERRGRGRAQADFTFELSEDAGGGTLVASTTEVTLVGAVAQYGRGAGMIQALADELTLQFASNLARLIETGEVEAGGGKSLSVARLAGRAVMGRFRRGEGVSK